jgi:hypothetical protein
LGALLPPNSVNPRTMTPAARSTTTAANPNRRRPARFRRRPRSLRVRYRAGSGFTILRTDDKKSAAFDLVRRAQPTSLHLASRQGLPRTIRLSLSGPTLATLMRLRCRAARAAPLGPSAVKKRATMTTTFQPAAKWWGPMWCIFPHICRGPTIFDAGSGFPPSSRINHHVRPGVPGAFSGVSLPEASPEVYSGLATPIQLPRSDAPDAKTALRRRQSWTTSAA